MADYRGIPKEAGDAETWAAQAKELWADRDTRMDADRAAWEMSDIDKQPGDEIFRLNDCTVLIDKAAEMLGTVEWDAEAAAGGEEDRDVSQRIEDFLRWYMDELDLRRMQAGAAPFQSEVAFSLALPGWWCFLTLFNPNDPSFPWTIENLDPRYVYPDTLGLHPRCVIHQCETTTAELAMRWGAKEVAKALGKEELPTDPENVTCYGYYTDTEMAYSVDGHWLKKPTEHYYGFNPLVRIVAKGNPFRQRPNESKAGPSAYIGTGLLQSNRPTAEDLQEVATISRTLLAKTADPVTGLYVNNPQRWNNIPKDAGETFVARPGESLVQYTPPPAALQHAQSLFTLGKDSIARGGLASQVFGAGAGNQPGYALERAEGASTDSLAPLLKAMGVGYLILFRQVLQLFGTFGGPDVNYIVQSRQTGQRSAAGRLSPLEVLGVDTRIKVRFGKLGQPNLPQMATVAATLIDRGVIDIETAVGELLHFPNPTAIRRRARRDQADKDPMWLRLEMLYEKAQDAMDPMAPLAAQMLKLTIQQMSMQMAQQMMQMQGAQAPMGGPNAPPLPNSGVPSAVLPDELGQNAGLGGQAQVGAPQVGAGIPQLLAGAGV